MICVQNSPVRQKKWFSSFTHLAEEVREILASLGVASLDDVVGRTDMLRQVSRGNAALDDLDLNPILVRADGNAKRKAPSMARNEVPDTLDALMLDDASHALDRGQRTQLSYNIKNTQRAYRDSAIIAYHPEIRYDRLETGHDYRAFAWVCRTIAWGVCGAGA
jgi:glutamate synthase (NADPH/NADH) large chain